MGNDSKIKRMRREMRLVLREEALKADELPSGAYKIYCELEDLLNGKETN